jgi:hypothetical protein
MSNATATKTKIPKTQLPHILRAELARFPGERVVQNTASSMAQTITPRGLFSSVLTGLNGMSVLQIVLSTPMPNSWSALALFLPFTTTYTADSTAKCIDQDKRARRPTHCRTTQETTSSNLSSAPTKPTTTR